MDVETRLLRYFAAVAEEGNLTRAAQRLFISQPALTKQVRQLEDRLGVQLFVRSRAGMTLTPPGRVLAEHIPKLLSDWDTAVKDVECAARRSSQVLRVGFLASAANEATPRIIAAFTRTRPGWHIEMRQAAWSNPTAGLLTGEADVAFLRLPAPTSIVCGSGNCSLNLVGSLFPPGTGWRPGSGSSSMSCGTNRSLPRAQTLTGGATIGWQQRSADTAPFASEPSPTTLTNGSTPLPTGTASHLPRRRRPATTHVPVSCSFRSPE